MKLREAILVIVACAVFGLLTRQLTLPAADRAVPMAPASFTATPAIKITTTPHQLVVTPTITRGDIEEMSLEGVRLNMSRREVLQLWGACDRGSTSSLNSVEEILEQKIPDRSAFISPQGKVRTILGGTLKFRSHLLKPGATFQEFQSVFGQLEEFDNGGGQGSWSCLGGALQAHYGTQQGRRVVYCFELRNGVF